MSSSHFLIRYLQTAEKDIDEIFSYILLDNPSAAASLLKEFDKSISQLSNFPKLGVVPKDKRLNKLGYRILVTGNYLIFYVLKIKTIQIRRIIHGARKYKFLI